MVKSSSKSDQVSLGINGRQSNYRLLFTWTLDTPAALQLILQWVESDVGKSKSIDELENIVINRITDVCQQFLI